MIKARFGKSFKVIFIIATLIFAMFFTIACNDDDKNEYLENNNFEVLMTDCEDALEFSPVGFTPRYGVVFYVGALIAPEYYSYLGNALAKQGYLVLVPKFKNNMTINDYNPNIAALRDYPNVTFFLAGHDMGGGTAVRHAMDYAKHNYSVAGLLLYAPTTFGRQKYENGEAVYDEERNPVWEYYDVSDYSIPTLLLEVDESSRTDSAKLEAENRINTNKTTKHTLENSRSIFFHTMTVSENEEPAVAQRNSTVSLTLEFLRSIVYILSAQA